MAIRREPKSAPISAPNHDSTSASEVGNDGIVKQGAVLAQKNQPQGLENHQPSNVTGTQPIFSGNVLATKATSFQNYGSVQVFKETLSPVTPSSITTLEVYLDSCRQQCHIS